MSDIKSAFEIAMEKVNKIGKATDEELMQWKYIPEGEKLGAKYLREETDIVQEINKYDLQTSKYITQGAVSTLARNIALPNSDLVKKTNKRAMDGLKILKKDKVKLENVYSQIRRLFSHYSEQGEAQRKQAYQQVKTAFEQKVQQALQQQLGSNASGMKIDVEKTAQFQEEWRKTLSKLDYQYTQVLDGYIQEVLELS